MEETALLTEPDRGDATAIAFWKRMAAELPERSRHVLNDLARAVAERGWVAPIPSYLDLQVEHGEPRDAVVAAVRDLVRRRLLLLDEAGEKVTGLLGAVSIARTPHEGRLENGVQLFTGGGADLLALGPMFARSVHARTSCGRCGAAISFHMVDDTIVDAEPSGLAGFQAAWDGRGDLAAVSARSPLFCGDACLAAWTEAEGEPPGLPLAADLLLHVGVMMAVESGAARFEMIRR